MFKCQAATGTDLCLVTRRDGHLDAGGNQAPFPRSERDILRDGRIKVEPGGTRLLVGNDAGSTASFTVPAGYTRLRLASCKYWSCGVAEVFLDGEPVATVDLESEDSVWGAVIYENLALDPDAPHTLSLRATGTGGPGVVYIDGVPYDLSWMHFVNVQWLRYW